MLKGLPKSYNIKEERFRELYYYCLQYHHWVKELRQEDIALQRKKELNQKITQIDLICNKVHPELASYIKRGVTEKNATYIVLRERYDMPCSRNTYYKYRRKFYWLLDKEKSGV